MRAKFFFRIEDPGDATIEEPRHETYENDTVRISGTADMDKTKPSGVDAESGWT